MALSIKWAANPNAWLFHDVRVDHGRGDVLMTQQCLDRAYVRSSLQQMGGKRMPKRVWRDRSADVRRHSGLSNRTLKCFRVAMKPHLSAGVGAQASRLRWEDELPSPLQARTGILALQCKRERYPT